MVKKRAQPKRPTGIELLVAVLMLSVVTAGALYLLPGTGWNVLMRIDPISLVAALAIFAAAYYFSIAGLKNERPRRIVGWIVALTGVLLGGAVVSNVVTQIMMAPLVIPGTAIPTASSNMLWTIGFSLPPLVLAGLAVATGVSIYRGSRLARLLGYVLVLALVFVMLVFS